MVYIFFSFCCLCFLVSYLRNHCLIQCYKDLPLCFLPGFSFAILALKFSSWSIFTFLYSIRVCVLLYSFIYKYRVVWASFVEKTLLSLFNYLIIILVEISWPLMYEFISQFYSVDFNFYSYICIHCLDYHGFVIFWNWEIRVFQVYSSFPWFFWLL